MSVHAMSTSIALVLLGFSTPCLASAGGQAGDGSEPAWTWGSAYTFDVIGVVDGLPTQRTD